MSVPAVALGLRCSENKQSSNSKKNNVKFKIIFFKSPVLLPECQWEQHPFSILRQLLAWTCPASGTSWHHWWLAFSRRDFSRRHCLLKLHLPQAGRHLFINGCQLWSPTRIIYISLNFKSKKYNEWHVCVWGSKHKATSTGLQGWGKRVWRQGAVIIKALWNPARFP